ncbi:MAG: cadherin domain-containing protein, partial [Cyanobacteria bacterium J06648_11]
SATGDITVADTSQLDFESASSFTLELEVISEGNLADTAIATITLNDLNEAPTVLNQSFSIDENSANATPVGTIVATDVDAGTTLTYSVTGGTGNTAFSVDAATGAIAIADTSQLDFESNSSFTLDIEVSDGSLTDTASITVNINDINETPTVLNQSFSIDENSPNTISLGTLIATDPDNDSLTFAATGGTGASAFGINATTGSITVIDSAQLDFEASPNFTLNVEVSDGSLTDTAIATINLNDLNEAPIVTAQSLSLDENSAAGTSVGSAIATDPDSDTLTFAALGGTGISAFGVNATTGEITVVNPALLDFETNPNLTLIVEASDGTLTDSATIAIAID